MNIKEIKMLLENMKNKKVYAKVYIGRNKYEIFDGILLDTYSSIFTIMVKNQIRSFSYADVITKNIIIKKM